VNILFKTEKEKEFYQDFNKLKKKHGLQLAKIITRRIQEMESFESVGTLFDSKLGKGHFLKGQYKGYFALSLTGNFRLIVEPQNENTDLSHLDLNSLKIVTIIKVEDYHGK
jgi:mRNA-degrading endonuclease YafQ of YafQ-DinJ toxin-antitoxin module